MQTQITQFNLDFFKIYDPIFPKIDKLLQTTGRSQIIDLCSGSSGPWPRLIKQLHTPVKVILTDKYPNLIKWEQVAQNSGGQIDYCRSSVDAQSVPGELNGVRTIFTGFHHFKPEDAKKVLGKIVSQEEPIAIFEFTGRNLRSILQSLGLYFVLPYLETPFIKPLTWSRFFWTYIIPVVPFLDFWDGLVSNIRTYTIKELWEIVNSLPNHNYHWEIGLELVKSHGLKGKIEYLIGYKNET